MASIILSNLLTLTSNVGSLDNNTEALIQEPNDITSDIEEDTTFNTSNLAPLSEPQNAELDKALTSVLDSIDDTLNSLDNVEELNLDEIN